MNYLPNESLTATTARPTNVGKPCAKLNFRSGDQTANFAFEGKASGEYAAALRFRGYRARGQSVERGGMPMSLECRSSMSLESWVSTESERIA